MSRTKPPLIIDGQPLADSSLSGLDLENFIRALDQADNHQLTIVVDQNFPRQKPALAEACPKINWQRLDLKTEDSQAWSAASRNQRQQALNSWLTARRLIGCPFVISQPTNPSYQPAWPAHSYKICLWPNQIPNAADGLGYLNLLVEADLILTPTKTIADELTNSNLLDPNRIAVIGQGGLGLAPPKLSAPNPGPEGDFVLWPISEDEVAANQLVAVAWRLFKKQTGHRLELVVVGDISPAQKADIKSRVGRRVFFGRRLTAERLAWLYAKAAAVLLIRQQPGPLTPLIAALDKRRPVVASPTKDFQEVAPEGINYCDGRSILEIARAIDRVLADPLTISPSQQQRLRRDFDWTKTGRRFNQARQKAGAKSPKIRPKAALVGRSQLPAGTPGREIGLRPAGWSDQLQIDYFYEGRPPDQTDDNWLAKVDSIAYRPLIDLPGDQLDSYQTRVYYLSNHPDCYQTLLRALIFPGIVVAPSLRFDRAWRQLVATGFVSQRRFQLEVEAEQKANVDDDCRGAWSLIKRSTGLVVETASDLATAKKIKKPANRAVLVEAGQNLDAAIAELQTKTNPKTSSYIDLSSLANNWLQQPWLTGIQRYEHQLLAQARLKWPNVKFVFWRDGPESMVVIPPKVVDSLVELIANFQTNGSRQKLNRRQAKLKQAFMSANHYLVANPGDRLLIPQGLWENHPYARFVSHWGQQLKIYQFVHDLIPITHPQYTTKLTHQSFSNYLAQIAPSQPSFVTTSKNTQTDLKNYYRQIGLPSPQAFACPLGDNPLATEQTTEEVADLVGRPFILSVGTIEPRKNHQLLLEAYQKDSDGSLPLLCIAGRVGWLISDLLSELKNHPKIMLLTNATDRQLAWLYQNCVLAVFPSLYEGWGLPVGESLAWGCPTLSSNAASLPEVGGQLADYFDPTDSDQLLALMKKYLDPKTNLAKRDEIKSRYRPRSWAESIDQVLEIVSGEKPQAAKKAPGRSKKS